MTDRKTDQAQPDRAQPDQHGRKEMQDAVENRRRRDAQWQREGERSLWQNLSMIGAFGWLIVVPMLLGAVLGRWLDGVFGMDVFFSGSLIFLGACLGGAMIWKRMNGK